MFPEGCLCEGCTNEDYGCAYVTRSDEEDVQVDLVQSLQANGRHQILGFPTLLPAKLDLSVAFFLQADACVHICHDCCRTHRGLLAEVSAFNPISDGASEYTKKSSRSAPDQGSEFLLAQRELA